MLYFPPIESDRKNRIAVSTEFDTKGSSLCERTYSARALIICWAVKIAAIIINVFKGRILFVISRFIAIENATKQRVTVVRKKYVIRLSLKRCRNCLFNAALSDVLISLTSFGVLALIQLNDSTVIAEKIEIQKPICPATSGPWNTKKIGANIWKIKYPLNQLTAIRH